MGILWAHTGTIGCIVILIDDVGRFDMSLSKEVLSTSEAEQCSIYLRTSWTQLVSMCAQSNKAMYAQRLRIVDAMSYRQS